MLPLIADAAGHVPEARALARALAGRARVEAALDAVRERDLQGVLRALDSAGLRVVLLKGTAVAHAVYQRPDLRARVDTDVLIRLEDRQAVDRLLQDYGYQPVAQVEADLVMYQTAFEIRREGATLHVIDVHWRVMNPQRFGGLMTFDEVQAHSVPLPRLGAGARGPSLVYALLLACVHRIAHHRNSDRLIWQYDIHLLASRLSESDWARFVDLALERGVGTACLASLDATNETFGAPIPAAMRDRLAEARAGEEAVAGYLAASRPHVLDVLDDLRALPTWRARWHLVGQHLLPSPGYMREVYAPRSSAPLGVLYLQRAWRGARKWFTRS